MSKIRQIVHRVRARIHTPMLSVILPCRNGEDFIEKAVRSVLNQSFRDLELIVIDDQSTDRSAQNVAKLAQRDSRIRLVKGQGRGPGAGRNLGLSHARGRFITFVDADDLVLPGAYESMIDALKNPEVDFVMGGYLRHGATGTHRPKNVQRIHELTRETVTAAEFPQVLEESFVWNKMFRTDFWKKAELAFPEDRNFEDHEPCFHAAMRARAFTVLSQDVYSWRLPEGRMSRSQGKDRIENLRDRVKVVESIAQILPDAPPEVQAFQRSFWLSSAIAQYSCFVGSVSDDYVALLSRAVRVILDGADMTVWEGVPFWERLTAWALSTGNRNLAEEVVASRTEDTASVPWVVDEGGVAWVSAPVLSRVGEVPDDIRRLTSVDMVLGAGVREIEWLSPLVVRIRGYAYLCGSTAPESDQVCLELVGTQGQTLGTVWVDERFVDQSVDVQANDPYRSYAGAGWGATIDLGEYASQIYDQQGVRIRVRVTHGTGEQAALFSACAWLEYPPFLPAVTKNSAEEQGVVQAIYRGQNAVVTLGYLSPREVEQRQLSPLSSTHEDGSRQHVWVDRVQFEAERVLVSGTISDVDVPLEGVLLASSQRELSASEVSFDGTTWRAIFDLNGMPLPHGGYFLRWQQREDAAEASAMKLQWCQAGELERREHYFVGHTQSVRVNIHANGAVALTVGLPLSLKERCAFHRQQVIERAPSELIDAIVFESFSGKNTGDNPGAICQALQDEGIDVPLYWSVVDGSVPVPSGTRRIIRGTDQWAQVVRSARVVVTNNHFPAWVKKTPGQVWVQTWHGTPIKRLLFDAPRQFIPLPYRRLMARQVPQWDVLLAQTAQAARDLVSSTGYQGEVMVVEQPRNWRLVAGAERGRQVRQVLGIEAEARVVLYAPTWREAGYLSGESDALLDVQELAREHGVTVLLRSHHMNNLRAGGAGVINVSAYPHVEDLMLAADILISDYSSIFFDWDLLGKPAVAYVPDLEYYRDVERGFYGVWPREPWQAAQDVEGLNQWLKQVLSALSAAEPRVGEDLLRGQKKVLEYIRQVF